jgi:hypothetical protein
VDINGWRYYNHAAIPTTEPHEIVDTSPILDKTIWKIRGGYSPISPLDFGLGLRT